MADHVGRFATGVAAHIAIHPHTLTPLAGDELHEAIVDPVFPDSPEIVVEEMPRVRREKVAQVLPDAVLRFIPERSGGCRVDEEQMAVEIVRTNQPEAVFNEIAVTPFAERTILDGALRFAISSAVFRRRSGVGRRRGVRPFIG